MDDGGYGLGPAFRDVRTVYEVIGANDQESAIHYGYYADATVAEKIAHNKGAWGSNALVKPRRAIANESGNLCYLIENDAPVKIYRSENDFQREKVLAKRTLEERRILGL